MSINNEIDEHFGFVSASYKAGFMVCLTMDRGVRADGALESLNRDLDKPFGEVPLAVRALAFTLWQDGYPLEVFGAHSQAWIATRQPVWAVDCRYRLLAKPEEIVLPSIDWSHIASDYRWLAQNENGAAFVATEAPYVTQRHAAGWSFPGSAASAAHFASFKGGKGDWRKLIVQRPEGA